MKTAVHSRDHLRLSDDPLEREFVKPICPATEVAIDLVAQEKVVGLRLLPILRYLRMTGMAGNNLETATRVPNTRVKSVS